MSTDLTETELAARRTRVAASNRSFGRVLSIVGVTLCALGLGALFGGGLAFSWADQAASAGTDREIVDAVTGIATTCLTLAPGLLVLLAMCCLIPGEQMRRGWIGVSPKPQTGLLPSASHVSEFRILGHGWHLLWAMAGLVLAVVLIGVPVASWFTGAWPATLSDSHDFTGFWVIYGAIALGISVAAFTSLIKKLAYRRQGRLRGPAIADGGPGQAFWRWVDYRWRFDLWLAGVGGMMVGISPMFLSEAVGANASVDALATELPAFLTVTGIGVGLVVIGIVATVNFWRAGESLGSGESFA